MTQDEIIEMAIEARLAFDSEEYPEIWQTYMNVGKQEIEAFAKLVAAKEREALAQTQEPVALETLLKWDDDIDDIDPIGEVVGFIEGSPYIMVKVHKGKQVSLDDDLYATPPQRSESSGKPSAWVGLTDEDRQAAFESMPDMLDGFLKTWGWLHFSKAIEAKLKEKNT